jgi:hydroxymethylpyrimidine/phosphomethylpyrimidine kinase
MLGTAEITPPSPRRSTCSSPGTPGRHRPRDGLGVRSVLLDEAARGALVELLLPRATVITPNVPEARVLAEAPDAEPEALVRALHRLGPRVVVVTGGHREPATDVLFDGEALHELPGERHPDGAAHGSGCTHSSALAAHLALGSSPLEAARAARSVASAAVRDGLRAIGAGAGPVDALGSARAVRQDVQPATPVAVQRV